MTISHMLQKSTSEFNSDSWNAGSRKRSLQIPHNKHYLFPLPYPLLYPLPFPLN